MTQRATSSLADYLPASIVAPAFRASSAVLTPQRAMATPPLQKKKCGLVIKFQQSTCSFCVVFPQQEATTITSLTYWYYPARPFSGRPILVSPPLWLLRLSALCPDLAWPCTSRRRKKTMPRSKRPHHCQCVHVAKS